MNTIPFDTLKYANKLMKVGFTKEQAEIQAEAIAELINNNLATKRDLKDLETSLLLKLGGMMAASIAIIAALVKLL